MGTTIRVDFPLGFTLELLLAPDTCRLELAGWTWCGLPVRRVVIGLT